MKSKSIPIKKYVIQYGFLLGLSIIIYSLVNYSTGNYTTKSVFHYSILFLITLFSIVIGLISFKRKNNYFISLSEALKIGIGITVLGGFMVTFWEIIVLKVIDPEIITQFEDRQIKKIAETSKDFSQENIERKIAIIQKFTSPWIMIIKGLVEDIIVGFFLSFITGLIIRKKRDPFS
ncbi:DUF4199 domain-containing protein [Aquimarina litoralis]|uniref:DUF4199 domain-containing protein n=1 Tax=Aquimarina litoralis TaxID=584605 RepID=UPI001C594F0C|nr:DUF4199 domain-containing protein [Aquimarina litoralis]MBW1295745.1 DUF4199 family protein [Aquimarina litoralis]